MSVGDEKDTCLTCLCDLPASMCKYKMPGLIKTDITHSPLGRCFLSPLPLAPPSPIPDHHCLLSPRLFFLSLLPPALLSPLSPIESYHYLQSSRLFPILIASIPTILKLGPNAPHLIYICIRRPGWPQSTDIIGPKTPRIMSQHSQVKYISTYTMIS